MTYKVQSGFTLEQDGRAARGPKLNPLDKLAIARIKSGEYADASAAAKDLAPQYRPKVWADASTEQRRDMVKSKRRQYSKLLARLAPCQG